MLWLVPSAVIPSIMLVHASSSRASSIPLGCPLSHLEPPGVLTVSSPICAWSHDSWTLTELGSRRGQPWRDKFLQRYDLDEWFNCLDNVSNWKPYDGYFLREGEIVVPNALNLKLPLVQELLDIWASPKTRQLVDGHYRWPTLAQDVEHYVLHYPHCQRNEARNIRPMGLLPPLELPLCSLA
jgi:hypothetical protein